MSRRNYAIQFDIHDEVTVKPVTAQGVVTQIKISCYATEYLVAYWSDGEKKEEWMYEWEIEAA